MTTTETKSYEVKIFIAGSLEQIKQACRMYCSDVGLCVTVTPTTYIYTYGEEEGAIIGLINYPRFPAEREAIMKKATELAQSIMISCRQKAYTIQDSEKAIWVNREL